MVTGSRKRSEGKARSTRRKRGEPFWVDFADRELLALRFCDLGVRLEGTHLEDRVGQLHEELAARGLRFRPHCWLSEEWFSPDGVPGIALPFYLAHARLMQLEARQMCDVEGGTESSCMRLLRHEAGHAVDTAYRLRHRKRWQQVFGKPDKPYPQSYRPKPNSRKHVLHLDWWYAQSHPTEDFAETFAVWLKPGSRWRRHYEGWPALRKLEYVDEVMREIGKRKPRVETRKRVDPLSSIRQSLESHYASRRANYQGDYPEIFDHHLRRLFATENGSRQKKTRSAAAFLRRYRPELRRAVARGTGEHPYTVEQVLNEMILRCRELGLRLGRSEEEVKLEVAVLLTAQTVNQLLSGDHRVPL